MKNEIMQIHIDDFTYNKLVNSIAHNLLDNLGDDIYNSCLIGVGESGINTAQTIHKMFDSKCEIKSCDVDKKSKSLNGLDFDSINDKIIIICDSIINTGTTVGMVRDCLIKYKPRDIKILTVILRNGSPLVPNYYALMIEKNDDVFYNINKYPVYKYHFGLIRKIDSRDANKHFKSGNKQIDKWCMVDYLHSSAYSQSYSTYVFDVNNEIYGVLAL